MRNDGGPAFPGTIDKRALEQPAPGMSLRDYFAAAALQGITSSPGGWWWKHADGSKQHLVLTEEYVKFAYEMADAMLAERQPPKPPLEVTEADREQGATDMERAYPRREP